MDNLAVAVDLVGGHLPRLTVALPLAVLGLVPLVDMDDALTIGTVGMTPIEVQSRPTVDVYAGLLDILFKIIKFKVDLASIGKRRQT